MENTNNIGHRKSLNVISNRRIKIGRYRCPFCTDSHNHKPPSFKTSFSAIWHLCHNHKDEADLAKELEELKKLAKVNHDTQTEAAKIV
jgi:hypothetical protein